MSLFCCPICGRSLCRTEKTYVCSGGHSYDIAREGYTHLLPANQKHSASPGDDREMVRARRDFLAKGYYRPLLDALCRLALEHGGTTVLDAGCGEGYYTSGIFRALAASGERPRMAGIDLSKYALRLASRLEPDVEFAVASCYHLPVADRSVDLLTDCFAPLAVDEFRRALRPGGAFLYVVPAADHLWELKEALYDAPYRNPQRETPYPGFTYETIVPVDGVMELRSGADVQNLFRMTPYCWNTPASGRERLTALTGLNVRFSFRIHVFRRNGEEGGISP